MSVTPKNKTALSELENLFYNIEEYIHNFIGRVELNGINGGAVPLNDIALCIETLAKRGREKALALTALSDNTRAPAWQEIGSAPRDGKVILLYNGEFQTAWWDGSYFRAISQPESEEYSPLHVTLATHWMPLPHPPTEGEKK